MSFFYFIEKVFSWNEIIIPMLSMSFESSLIWYSERGQTSIFITHSKCHFHAAISFTSYFSTLHVLKKAGIKPRSTGEDVAWVFEALHDDIFKNEWEVYLVSKESWGVPMPPPHVTTKGESLPEGSHRTISPSTPWLWRCLFFCTRWRCSLTTEQGIKGVDFQFACGAASLLPVTIWPSNCLQRARHWRSRHDGKL